MTMKCCTLCKEDLPVDAFHKDKGAASGYRSWCKNCVRRHFLQFKDAGGYRRRLEKYAEQRKQKRADSPQQVWAHDTFHNAKKRASATGIPFTITKEDILAMLGDICPLLGIPLTLGQHRTVDGSPTIDRKFPELGYTKNNCWVVSAKANRIKSNATTAEIEAVARALRAAGI